MDQCEKLRGSITLMRWRGDNGFRIASILTENHEEIVAKGPIPEAMGEELLEMHGRWIDDPKWGHQFEVVKAYILMPSSLKGKETYLARHVKGVGPKMAAKIVAQFGHQIIDILDYHPERLIEVEGINPKLVDKIVSSWKEENDPLLRQVGLFLAQYGIGDAWASRFIKALGQNVVSLLETNPYRSMKVHGVGFKTADEFAEKMGWTDRSPERTEAAFNFVLQDNMEDGHVFVYENDLITEVRRVASSRSGLKKTNLIPEADIREALERVLDHEDLIKEEIKVNKIAYVLYYLPKLHKAEMQVAESIADLQTNYHEQPHGIEDCLDHVQEKLSQELTGDQRMAVINALKNNLSVITGKPGVGKTTVSKALIMTAEALGLEVICCAPTGRAAKRMSEVTGREASTIHRLLQWNGDLGHFMRDSSHPLEGDLCLVDESTMIDIELFADFLDAVPDHMSVVMIGDVNQLPSIGPGAILRDLIESHRVCVTRLETIFRQAEDSLIVQNAHRMSQGEAPRFPEQKGVITDSYLIEVPRCENEEEHEVPDIEYVKELLPRLIEKICATQKIKEGFVTRPVDPIRDIQVLMPMQKGPAGAIVFNKTLQAALNPDADSVQLKFFEFRIGDRVMQLENNYDPNMMVFNGDIGFVKRIDRVNQELVIDMDDREVTYPFKETDQLTLAYASSVHKSQGSEYPVVLILLTGHHRAMLARNLIYTANTRGKQLVIWIAERWAIRQAIENNKVTERNSLLTLRIRHLVPKELLTSLGVIPQTAVQEATV